MSRRRRPAPTVFDHDANGVRLLSRQCETCIFRPGNKMSLAPGRLREICEPFRQGQGYMICHDTLPYGAYPGAGMAVCAGFYERFSTQFKQVGDRLRWWVKVDPPGEREPGNSSAPPRPEPGGAD